MGKTLIDWTDYSWNPVTGCTPISPACDHCYAKSIATRFAGTPSWPNGFDVTCHPERLEQPLHWRKPGKVFLCSAGDLFHEDVPESFIARVFARMAAYQQHTFQILTKRPERMLDIVNLACRAVPEHWPLPNVWLGVTAENQEMADKRIPLLLQVPAAVRFVSIEPMLGPVDLGMSTATCGCCERWPSRWVRLARRVRSDWPFYRVPGGNAEAQPGIYRAHSNPHGALSVETTGGLLGIKPSEFQCLPGLDWVIVGGETGPGARPMHPDWVRSVRDQCVNAGVPVFFKQWGEWFVPEDGARACRVCGCTEHNACVDELTGDGCSWVEPDLCSECAGEPTPEGDRPVKFRRVDKCAAGHLLDGVEWRQFPEATA